MNLAPDLLLSTGRTVKHTPQPNGSQLATPTPGPEEMTVNEWLEYCDLVRPRPHSSPANCARTSKRVLSPRLA